MQFAIRQRLFNACDPAAELDPGDARRVDLDGAWGDVPVRGIQWSTTLAMPIEGSAAPSRQLVAAFPGSGVSTELLRLAGRLRDPARANVIVARAEAGQISDLMSPIDIADVLLLVAAAAHQAVALEMHARPPEVSRRVRSFLPETLILPSDEGLTWSRLLSEIRLEAGFRDRFRSSISAGFSRFVACVRDELTALRDLARGLGRSGLMVMVDSLEKLSGSIDTRTEILASAERVFAADAEYLDLPVHTLYAVPPALLLRLRGVPVLPVLRVLGRDERIDEAGLRAARAMVRARVPDEMLGELLGASALEERVRRMIERTAGLPRDLVKLLQRVVARAPRDEAMFEQLLGEVGEIPARLLFERSYPSLARVHATGALPPVGPPTGVDRELDLALEVGAVLPYRDGRGVWFDVVPAVRELGGVAAEIGRVQAVA